jgi:hypothetical protein
MTLAEDSPPEQIAGWFREQGWVLTVHRESPPRGETSNVPRAIRVLPRFTHWADLVSLETGTVVARWYGGGMDEAQALRSAARRWRTEHGELAPQPDA